MQIPNKITILGVEYTIDIRSEEQDSALKALNGYCDYTTKTIVLADEGHYKTDIDTPQFGDIPFMQEKVLRHEVLHAFFWESGLSEYAGDEILIDFLAIQLPKIKQYL